MRSTLAIDVAARPELVFALARDVERWPRLLPHYRRVRVVARHADGSVTAEMVASRPVFELLGLGLPVAWRSRVWAEPDTLRIRFHHLGGATAGMEVVWRIESTPGGCCVSIEHTFRRQLPLPLAGGFAGGAGADVWPRLVDRLFIRPIAGRTLATFRALAEALAASDPPDPAYQRP